MPKITIWQTHAALYTSDMLQFSLYHNKMRKNPQYFSSFFFNIYIYIQEDHRGMINEFSYVPVYIYEKVDNVDLILESCNKF